MSRQAVLAMSIIVSLLVHAAVIVASPRVTLLRTPQVPRSVLETFHVRLTDDLPIPENIPDRDSDTSLLSRPSSIEELMSRLPESQDDLEQSFDREIQMPDMNQRLGADPVQREYEFLQNPETLKRVDAKIIEISQETAREEIQIARRLVAPSSTRILGEGEFPTLRGPREEGVEEILTLPPMPQSLPGGGGLAVAEDPGGKPPREEGVLDVQDDRPEKELPQLDIERVVARAPVVEEITRESPYEFIDDLVDIKLDTYLPPSGEEGFFRVQIVPKKESQIETLPQSVTFVVDASNSIQQRKLDETVKGLKAAIAKLRPEDRFNVVVFRDTPTEFQVDPVPATPEAKAAVSTFLQGIQSRGETDVYNGIRPVVLEKPPEGTPGVVVVITDGRPTAGIRDGRTIINSLTQENELNNSILAFGGGNTVNRYMLELLAYRNKGESYVAPRIEDISSYLPAFFDQFSEPVLTDCRANYVRIDEEGVFPKNLPDFYRGKAVTVYGRFDPRTDKKFAMRLTGLAGAQKKEVVFTADFQKAVSGDGELARQWAFQRIYYLIGEICRVGETPELLGELRELSRQYRIRTSYDE